MKKIVRYNSVVFLLRMLILYLILFLCRIVFYLYNYKIVGSLASTELFPLLKGSLLFDTASVLYLNALFVVLSLIPFHFREKNGYQKMLFWLFTVTNAIGLVALNLIDTVYYSFAFKRITPDELLFFQDDDNTASIMLRGLIDNWYLLLVFVALVALMIFLYKKIPCRHVKELKVKSLPYYVGNSLIFLLFGLLFTFGIRGTFSFENRPVSLGDAAFYAQDAKKASMILSNPFCIIRLSGLKEIEVMRFFDEKQVDDIFNPYHYPQVTGEDTFAKKNIVIFILEGFSKEHSKFLSPQYYPDGEGFTPFLDSLMAQGFVFRNAFANGTRSVESLPAIWASIPSYGTPFSEMPQCVNNLDALPRLLAQEGYSTHFFMGSHANQMGFDAFAKLAGVQQIHNRQDFEKVDSRPDMANVWGIWDVPFLQFMADELDKVETPFCATVYTLTSHHPFDLPQEYKEKMPAGTTPAQPCIAYTDLSIRKFFEKAKRSDWYENTLFVFVADHVSPKIAFEETRATKGRTAILYFMFTPDQSLRGSSTEVTQHLDLMPTTLGLIGYNKPYFAFGRDFFNEKERMPVATSYIYNIYQCITDSLTLLFDGQKRLQVYRSDDLLQKSNVRNYRDPEQQAVEEYLKALLQSYTQHVHDNNFNVPNKNNFK